MRENAPPNERMSEMNMHRNLAAQGCLLTVLLLASCGDPENGTPKSTVEPGENTSGAGGEIPNGFAPVNRHRNRDLTQWIEDIEGEDRFKRYRAIVAVGEMEEFGVPAVPAVSKCLADPSMDEGVKRKAIGALGRIGGEEAIRGLDPSMTGGDAILGVLAADALGAMGSSAVDSIVPYLSSLDANVRERGVRALKGVLHTDGKVAKMEASVVPLAHALADNSESVRREALGVLSELGPRALAASPVIIEKLRTETHEEQRKLLMVMLGLFGPVASDVAPILREDLENGSDELRLFAALTLAKVGFVDEGVPPLIEFLQHENPLLRQAAADAFNRIGPPAQAAIEPLKQAKKGANDALHLLVERALKSIRGEL